MQAVTPDRYDTSSRPDLVCPACRNALERISSGLACSTCASEFTFDGDIPQFVTEGSVPERDAQVAYYDHIPDADHEVARPWDRPLLHQWIIEEKFVKATRGLLPLAARGATALVVCGGSGLDAELLSRSGFEVTTSDISLGAARRATERALRRGVEYRSITADIGRLPFADESFDLVLVHDGLHHLLDPYAAITEMSRVARVAVSISEPVQSKATAIAIRLGVAENIEEAGNRVVRLSPSATYQALTRAGLSIVHESRCALYYRDGAGLLTRIASHPSLLPVARMGIQATSRIFGRWGNKLTIVAVRR